MSRHAKKLLLAACSLSALIVAMPLAAPLLGPSPGTAASHVDKKLLEGLQQLREHADSDVTPALAKVSRWLQRQTPATRALIEATPPKALAQWLARRDPYQLPGCLHAADGREQGLQRSTAGLCSNGDAGISLTASMPGAEDLAAQLSRYRQPGEAQPPQWGLPIAVSRIEPKLKTSLRKGPDVELTLRITEQAAAQQLLERMTARRPEPETALAERNARFIEGARARMLGLLVVNVATGAIEVAASSHSPCFEAHHKRAARPDCPELPPQQAGNPIRLQNAPLYYQGMIGSLAKLLQGYTLLSAQTPVLALQAPLLRSETEEMIDQVLCVQLRFGLDCANKNLASLKTFAQQSSAASIELLRLPGAAHPVFGSQLLQAERELSDHNAVIACHQSGAAHRWRGCKGENLVNTVAELFGQGNARATPVGVAAQWLYIAQQANGQALQQPFLATGQATVETSRRHSAPDHAAKTLLDILSHSLWAGTSRSACLAAQPYAAQGSQRLRCDGPQAELRIAAKTGTPVFRADAKTLSEWTRDCKREPGPGPARGRAEARARWLTDCRLSPIKWWAAAVGDNRQGWQKVIVVVAERNWKHDGEVDARGDIGANVAAEAGLAYLQGRYKQLMQPDSVEHDLPDGLEATR